MANITPYDLQRSDILTRMITKELANRQIDAVYDVGFLAPMRSIRETVVSFGLREPDQTQLGQFRALDGPTPLITTRYRGPQKAQIELVMLSEKDRITERMIMDLRSPDTRIAQEAAFQILNSGVNLAKRNINLSRWMVWQAVQDQLLVTYDGGQFMVDYQLDNSDGGMSESHIRGLPAIHWDDPTAEVISDVENDTAVITKDNGAPQTAVEVIMSDKTFKFLQKNIGIQEDYGTIDEPKRPNTTDQVAQVLGVRRIHLYDSTYRDASNAIVRFFPENKILYFVPSTDGARNIEMLDGPVPMLSDGGRDITVANNPGMRAEIWVTPDALSKNIRVTTSRIPFVARDAVLLRTVW